MPALRVSITTALIRNILFLGMVALSLASLLYTSRLAAHLERQTAMFTDLFARFAAASTLAASQNDEVQRTFRGFLDHVTFPIVVTDKRGVPWTCKGTGISPDEIPYDIFVSVDPHNPPPGPMEELLVIAYQMDSKRTPIPMIFPDTGDVFGYIHYGESPLVGQLRMMPVIQIAIAGLLVAIGYFGVRTVRQSERKSIWAGMAKETAHQLGTPISSLMGWIDLLEAEAGAGDESTRNTLHEMRADVARLGQVASRFERVGSMPKLELLDPNPIIRHVVEYLRRRLPSVGRRVEIVEQLNDVSRIRSDRELLSWTVENLLKNAADAILKEGGDGMIIVRTDPGVPDGVRIIVEDDGPGIPESIQNRIFEPGFTTKPRGWGLGLALAKRIVEEYHGGRIRLLRSTPNVRTVFVVDIPEDKHKRR